ncbi:Radical SAM superfamily protein [Enhygromyxa salina]|uniref:Radical SAM superfamily protein n=1 Tax=Enhygromyxa salina TaxID=215803 RepID=A0A2S9XIC1_9BACT|nr:AmmeMemoRadiSam system radical SAM enzyme [Enhygromyxa salina]PRP92626.1 Radical SAM superfamily protein [Enhygromyxa salina]
MAGATPLREEIEPGVVRGQWWHVLEDGRIQCDVCPRFCKLREGQKGFCFVREARDGGIVLTSYGRASGYCIDPIEKKPLNHFYPGSSVLSFGTAGCNLGCRHCQNWDISRAREDRVLAASASPTRVAEAAAEAGCRSVAFTYNDPTIFAEYAIDCAIEAHAHGLETVAVSSGYMTPEVLPHFYAHMDAVNIDLKAFTENFYRKTCFAHLDPVLDTLEWLRHETDVWLEVTTLLIPGYNDSETEVEQLCAWFVDKLGPDVPLHFSAFHPDFKVTDVPPTPAATLRRARAQAKAAGLQYVYTGNIRDTHGQSTYCTHCGQELVGRDGYAITNWHLDAEGRCDACGERVPGHFAAEPGDWGMKRVPVSLTEEAR